MAAATQLSPLSNLPKPVESRIEIIESLRGLAALAVCWFHFTNGNPGFLPSGILKSSGRYGWLGVDVFFVLSGFVIPYSLYRARYLLTVDTYKRFLWKRIIRLDPPYLASIGLVVALAYTSALIPGYRGSPPSISGLDVLLHVGYLNTFVHRPWLNVVYWSLAIEFQYYVLIGLLFPVIVTRRWIFRFGLVVLMGITALLFSGDGLICRYVFLFLMGISAFQYRIGLLGRLELSTTLTLGVVGVMMMNGVLSAVAGVAASTAILHLKFSNRLLTALGRISYSLYLVHVPVGGRIINLGEKTGGSILVQTVFLVLALVASVLAACILYRYVETPCREYSSALRLRDSSGSGIPQAFTKTYAGTIVTRTSSADC